MTRILRDLAHTRAGDKGDISCISVIAHRDEDFAVFVVNMSNRHNKF